MPVELDEFVLAKLAREMVMNIRPVPVVLADFGLDENGFYEISKNDFYKRAEQQFALEWNSALTVNERIKLISAAYLEQALPRLAQRMTGDEPLAAASEVAKLFSRNAGLGEVKADAKSSERFQITINLGAAHKEVYDKAIAIEAAADVPPALTLSHEDGRNRPDAKEETHGSQKELDGGSGEEARSAAPLIGRAGGGEDPGGEDREGEPFVEPDAAAASRAGEDLREAPAVKHGGYRLGEHRPATCRVDGCNNPANIPGSARGFCKRHYHMDRTAKVQARKAEKLAKYRALSSAT